MNPPQKRHLDEPIASSTSERQRHLELQPQRQTTYATRSSTRATVKTTTPYRASSSSEEQKQQQQQQQLLTSKRICRLPFRYRFSPVESIPESPRSDRSTSYCSSSSSSTLSSTPDDDEFDPHTTDVQGSSLRKSRNRSRSRNGNESRSRSSSRCKGEIIRRQGEFQYNPSPSIDKRRQSLRPLTSSKGRAVVADDFLQYFQDPPQAAQLQDPGQRDGM